MRLEHCDTRLSASVLALHVVHVGSFILTLIVVLAQAACVGCARYRRKRFTTTKPVRLRVSHAHIPLGRTDGTANDAGVVCDATTWTCILRDDRACITPISTAFGSVDTTRNPRTKRSICEHRQSRRIGRLGSKGLNIGRNEAKSIMRAVEAGIETAWRPRSPTCQEILCRCLVATKLVHRLYQRASRLAELDHTWL